MMQKAMPALLMGFAFIPDIAMFSNTTMLLIAKNNCNEQLLLLKSKVLVEYW
jgi:hypothetical protein